MKQAPDPDVEVSEGAELDAGWDEPSVPSVTVPAGVRAVAPAVASVVAPVVIRAAEPADDIDEGWDDEDDEGDEGGDGGVAAASAPLRQKPVPAPAHGAPPARVVDESGSRRTLSKKERRELERQNRVHASRKSSESKQSKRASRREGARRLAEERQKERAEALALAKKQAQQAKKAAVKARARRATEAADDDAPSAPVKASGTKRRGGKASRNAGRLKKQAGGGWIVALIALITVATGLYAWSKR